MEIKAKIENARLIDFGIAYLIFLAIMAALGSGLFVFRVCAGLV